MEGKMLIRTALFLVLSFSSSVIAAPVFVNAGFESPGTTGGVPTGWSLFAPSNTGFLTTDCRTTPPESPPAYAGSCSMRLNSVAGQRDVGVSQAVSGFIVGNTYTVTTQVANYFPITYGTRDTIDFAIRVLLAGGPDIASASSDSLGLGDSTTLWTQFSNTFVADATTITFEFAAQLSSDRSFLIDNVVITAVPIPAAVWLFGSGLLGLVGISRRKKQ